MDAPLPTQNSQPLSPQKSTQSKNDMRLKESFLKGFGLYDYQSAHTLQTSIQSVTIPKADRFPHNSRLITDESVLSKPNTLSKRSAFLGYGEKNCYPTHTLKIAKENPAPNNYIIKSEFDQNNKGKSFGLSYQSYIKVKLPHIDVISPEAAKFMPGPGQYEMRKEFGKDKCKAVLIGKGKTINELITFKAPPPNYYSPNNNYVYSSRYKTMTFGTGIRNSINNNNGIKNAPGPGTYTLKSKFDDIVNKNRFFKGFKPDKNKVG